MTGRKIERVSRGRRLTPEEVAHVRRARAEADAQQDQIRAHVRSRMAELADLRQVFVKLQQARQAQGLSLTDMQQRTGIDRSALAKLEKGLQPNPTLDTVVRVAAAVGKRVVVDLVDA
jgi:DNA-binding XRE family transcriptional regulator